MKFQSLLFTMLVAVFGFGQTPIAHYTFNNTLAATIGGSFGLATIGTVNSVPTATISTSGACTNNVNDYSSGLRTPNINTLSSTNFQVDLTISLSNLPTHASAPLFIVGAGRYFGLVLNQTGQLKVFYNNVNETSVVSGITLNTGTLYDIQIQYINGTTMLKVNNVLYLTTTLPTLSTVTSDRTINLGDNPGAGGAGGASAAVEGCYTNFKLYNNPMSFAPVYVNSATGDDVNGTGAQGSPVKSFHKAYQLLPVGGGTINLTGTFDWTNTEESGDASLTGYTLGKNLNIIGQGADQTIIQANPTANTADRGVFTISGSYIVNFNNLTIRHGNLTSSDGAGINNTGGTVTMNNCRVNANKTISGGGGGIRHQAVSTFTAIGCTFDGNSASSGGAFANGDVTNTNRRFNFVNCTFFNNSSTATVATVGAGAIWVIDGTNSTITNCTFSNNNLASGTGAGASILVRYGSLRIKNSIFVNGTKGGNTLGVYDSEIDFAGGSATDEGNNIIGMQYAAITSPQTSSFFDTYATPNSIDGIFTKYNSSPAQNCNLSISNTLALNGATNGIVTLETSGVSQDNGSTVANNGVAIPSVDQRGVARINLTDIGSYESNVTAPLVTLSTTSISSFATCTAEQSFTVSGTNLSGAITITAPTGYQVSLTTGTGFTTAVSLTPSNGTVNTTTIYAKINSSSAGSGNIAVSTVCSGTQNITVTGTVNSTFTWTGAISSVPTVAGNWSGSLLPCEGANIIIPSGVPNYPSYPSTLNIGVGGTYTVNSGARLTVTGVLTNNGTLTIESGATMLQGGIAGSGTYNIKQTITDCTNDGSAPTGRFWYMSIPLTSSTRSAAFGSAGTMNRLWSWSESGQTWSAQLGNTTTLNGGTGYVFRTGSNTTLNFTGTNIYNQNSTWNGLTNTVGAFDGCHLFANSFTAYLDWESVVAESGFSGISTTYCVRSYNTTNSTMVYDTYNATGDVAVQNSSYAVTRYIAPMQAFWITVNPSTTGTLKIFKSHLSHQPTATGLKELTSFPAFARLNLVSGDFYDQVVVYTDVNATAEFDDYDSKKFFLPNKAQVYCPVGENKAVINALKQGKAQTSAPLTVELPSTQVYKFEMAESFVENGLVILEDKQEGIFQDMGVNPVYEFYGNSGVIADRFVLHFQLPNGTNNEGQAGVEDLTNGQIAVIANHDGAVNVILSADLATSGDIQIFDGAGRLVAQKAITSAQTSLQLNNGMGVYFVRVQTPMKTETKKVMVY